MEDTIARQKKELKALEGEKRAAVKKAKGVKGKKGKELLARLVFLVGATVDAKNCADKLLCTSEQCGNRL